MHHGDLKTLLLDLCAALGLSLLAGPFAALGEAPAIGCLVGLIA